MNTNENFIIFSDVKRLFIRFKWTILMGATLFGALGFYIRTQMPISYEVVSTFKEANVTASHPGETFFNSMVRSFGRRVDQKGFYIITSSKILIPVVQKLGLQITRSESNWWSKKWEQLCAAIQAEQGKSIPLQERFVFENVIYDGEETEEFTLFFGTQKTFEVRSLADHLLTEGRVGEPVRLGEAQFVLREVPCDLELKKTYTFTLSSLHSQVDLLRKAIDVNTVKGDESLIELTFKHHDRLFGKQLLNSLMDEYQNYILSENERISSGQIAYLEKRRDELCTQMNLFLEDHVSYLKESLGETGFLSLNQRLPLLEQRKNGFSEQLLKLNLDEDALLGGTFGPSSEVLALQQELHSLTKARDEIELALIEKKCAPYHAKLNDLNLEQIRIKSGVDSFFSKLTKGLDQQKKERESARLTLRNFGENYSSQMHHLVKVQKEKEEVEHLLKESTPTEYTSNYLSNQYRLLSIQEDVLKQRLFHSTAAADDFIGMDTSALKKLLSDYQREYDNYLSKCRQLEFVKSQMDQEGVEWVSLAATCPDSISQEMALEMGKSKQRMRQKGGFTDKEIQRMERSFSEKKANLIKHIDQTIALHGQQVEHVKKRMTLVQLAILDVLGQDIALIEQQVKDRVEERLSQITQEKQLVQEQIDGTLVEMQNVPEMWLKERELQFSSEMHKGMLESLIRLVESKNIENNLTSIESKPLDLAYAPLFPTSPKLTIITLLGMMVGGFITFVACFIWTFSRGIPLTLENMKARARNVIGKLSSKKERNLETLRNFTLLLKEQRSSSLVVSLVLGKGLNYSTALATLLHREGKRVLVIDLQSSKQVGQEKTSGLIQYLEGESDVATVKKETYGASIEMGTSTLYEEELLKGKKFQDFLHDVKQQYDTILVCIPKSAKHSLPKSFFSYSDVMAVYLENTPFHALLPYFKWEDKGGTVAFTSA